MNASTLIQLCNYCNVLRADGMSYGDYLKQPPQNERRELWVPEL